MSKVYVAADMEGVAGSAVWNEVNPKKSEYTQFQNIYTGEAYKICDILSNSFDDIVYQDGHWYETNVLLNDFNKKTTIIRGNDGRGLAALNESYEAVVLHGYHAAGGNFEYPLSHTITDDVVRSIKLNDDLFGETSIAVLSALKCNVPIIYISGDDLACREAKKWIPNIIFTETKTLSRASYICKSPKRVVAEIEEDLEKALKLFKTNKNYFKVVKPKKFEIKIEYVKYVDAYKYSHYPNAEYVGNNTVKINCKSIEDVLNFIKVCI